MKQSVGTNRSCFHTSSESANDSKSPTHRLIASSSSVSSQCMGTFEYDLSGTAVHCIVNHVKIYGNAVRRHVTRAGRLVCRLQLRFSVEINQRWAGH